ncbi:MAG TPA: hypothetical protein VGF76_14320 [Polyangiaceae bacterium]
MKPARTLLLAAAAGLLLSASCSSDKPSDTATGPVGGLVMGDKDTHCDGQTPVVVDPASCMTPEAASGEGGAPADSGSTSQAGASDCNAEHDAQYGETLYNDSGDDDDCKYTASWTSTPIRLNQDVTFTVMAKDLTSNKPLEALDDGQLALTRIEIYQPCQPTRRLPAQDPKFTETAPGAYTGGPIRFDQSGRWVVRFHFYEQCLDGDTSPHGHIAFFIDVP